MKDNFSVQSDKYARYRPTYPDALFDFLITIAPAKRNAWDCGTGNGQVALKLAKDFENVYATDISRRQLQNAFPDEKINYSLQPAEKTTFSGDYFDLVTVAQAIHWFDFDKFYKEVRRTVKHNGVLAVLGYGLLRISPGIDRIIADFYYHTLGAFWDKERKYVDENYQTIPFPFREVKTPEFENTVSWSFEHLIGFLETGSAVQHFTRKNGVNPISLIYDDLKKKWGKSEIRAVNFPVLFRVGRIKKD